MREILRHGRLTGAALLALVALGASPALAAGLSDPEIRAFVAGQQAAWNARAVDRFFGLFTPQATFSDQYRTPDGKIVPYGSSTRTQAQAQTRKFLAKARSTEAGELVRIERSRDGRSVIVLSRVTSRQETGAKMRTLCAERVQRLSVMGGRIRSAGQSDTFMACPGAR
jgi:hypothetical protein